MSVDQQDRDQNAGESGWQPQPQGQPETPERKRHRVRNTFIVVVGLTVALIATVAIGGAFSGTSGTGPTLRDAVAKSDHGSADGITYGDNDKTLSLDGEGKEDHNDVVKLDTEMNILQALNISTAIEERIGNTRALDGTLSGEWGTFKATWTYHPDNGLDIVIEDTR
jgi:hypothetical protein